MQHLPVHWSEGLFLRPHHFQAADRYWEELVHRSALIHQPYGYGVESVKINEAALANGRVEVESCSARLRDGTIIDIDAGDLDRLDVKERLGADVTSDAQQDPTDRIKVYLGVPRLKLGRANTANDHQSSHARYYASSKPFEDESSGGNRQDVGLKNLNAQVLIGEEATTGFEAIPICQVRISAEQGIPVLDTDYFPPCLDIMSWLPLGIRDTREIYDLLSQRADTISRTVRDQGITLNAREPGDLEKLWLLSALNQSIGRLYNLAFAQGVHPFDAYRSLCEIVGSLSIFSADRRIPEIPAYDHDDLARIFRWARMQIEGMLQSIAPSVLEQAYFLGAGLVLQVSLKPKWFDSNWDMYMGINHGKTPRNDFLRMVQHRSIDWKIASSDRVESVFRNREAGLKFEVVQNPPRELPKSSGWLYCSIPTQSPEWQHVERTHNLSLRFNEEQINNLAELEGQRRIVIAAQGQPIALEFAMFAVRRS